MTLMTEDELDVLFDSYDAPQNEDEAIFYEEADPIRSLQYKYLKRLSGHQLFLGFSGNQIIEGLKYDSEFDFDLDKIKENNFTSITPYITDDGKSGNIRLNWLDRTLVVTEDGSDEPLFYTVSRFRCFSIARVSSRKLEFGILIDTTTAVDEEEAKTRGMTSYDVDKLVIEMGVLAQMDGKGYVPSRPVTAKDIARATGVSASTLSELRTGKKLIDNLTFSTLSVLTTYGAIKELEGNIHDVFTGIILQPRIDNTKYRTIIELVSGDIYQYKSATEESAEDDFRKITMDYNDADKSLNLENVLTETDETLLFCAIPKDSISHIYVKLVE